MNGKAVILHLAAAGPNVVALVDPEQVPSRISGGVLQVGVALPALHAWKISSVDFKVLSGGPTRRVTQRIQVTCYGRDLTQANLLLQAVRKDCDGQRLAVLGDLTDIDVQTDGEGFEGFEEMLEAYAETQDFRVSYNEPR